MPLNDNDIQKALDKRKKEQEEELKKLEERKLASEPIKDKSGAVNRLFEDKQVESPGKFTQEGEKTTGISSGYSARRNRDHHMFMLKHAYTKHKHMVIKQDVDDRRDLVTEFVMAPLYKRLLYNNAPEVELVVDHEQKQSPRYGNDLIQPKPDEKNIFIRSKFFEDFETLHNFSDVKSSSEFTKHKSPEVINKLAKVEGFEKVIAASILLGEVDYHAGNIGVVRRIDEEGKEHFVAVKIDHGRSAMYNASSELALRKEMLETFRSFGYIQGDTQLVPFSAQKFKDSIDEMLKISDDEIRLMTQSRTHILHKANLDLNGIDFLHYEDGTPLSEYANNDPDKTEKIFSNRVIKQKKALVELSKTLEIIIKSNAPDEIKNGNWLADLAGFEPVKWAFLKGYNIEGKNAIQWAIENGHKINNKDPIIWANENNYPIEGKNAIQWAIENGHKINKKDPIIWANENNYPIEGKNAIQWAIENGRKINNKDPIIWADENNYPIEGKNAIQWAKGKKFEIEGILTDWKDPNTFKEENQPKASESQRAESQTTQNGIIDYLLKPFANFLNWIKEIVQKINSHPNLKKSRKDITQNPIAVDKEAAKHITPKALIQDPTTKDMTQKTQVKASNSDQSLGKHTSKVREARNSINDQTIKF